MPTHTHANIREQRTRLASVGNEEVANRRRWRRRLVRASVVKFTRSKEHALHVIKHKQIGIKLS